ncbi:MAG: xanthine dehydrogenase family protein molybdopterin-binding subunit [Treponema sp.]|nr:xanthine dehydrogenase family protein molybdopterin-binding subunit [Treponema sp.]
MKDTPLFAENIAPGHSLYAVVIRSPAARGKIKALECPRLPGNYTLIKAPDIPGKNQLDDLPVPVLAAESVSYIGEPVALLAGSDEVRLEEYAGQCRVVVDEESPSFSRSSFPPGAVLARRDIHIGDAEEAFSEAVRILGGNYRTSIQDHWCSDPGGAVAIFTETAEDFAGDPREEKASGKEKAARKKKRLREKLLIHTATQWPFHVKRSIVSMLNIDPGMVAVEPSLIGVHLDGKIWYPSLIACHAALGAFLLKKTVRIIPTRLENFRYAPKRNGVELRFRSALGEGGRLLGTEISLITDMGAQEVFTEEILDRTCLAALGPYNWETAIIQGAAIRTNVPPAGSFSGFGMAQGFFASERQASRIADALRIDPAEWRKQFFSKNPALSMGIRHRDHILMEELLDTTTAMSDYRRKWASFELLRVHRRKRRDEEKGEPLRGIGIAVAYQGSGFLYAGRDRGTYSVELTLDKEGFLEIRTSMVSSDQEHILLWQSIAAEILTLEAGAVRVVSDNTEGVPDSGPACLSRNVTVITHLVERACGVIRKQRFRDPLPITVRRSYHPARAAGWGERPVDQNVLTHLSWGAAVAEVEIDPVEYSPRIKGVWLGIDGGRILSESRARRSLKLGAIHALSWASREELVYEEGRIPDAYFHNYSILSLREIPPIHIDFIWNDTVNPKGIGELPFNCIPAAYVQAVSQAMDYPFEKIPLTAKDVWDAKKKLEEKEHEA